MRRLGDLLDCQELGVTTIAGLLPPSFNLSAMPSTLAGIILLESALSSFYCGLMHEIARSANTYVAAEPGVPALLYRWTS